MNIENVIYLRTQVVGQLEDARRRLEDEDRRRSLVEASLHQVLPLLTKLTRKYRETLIPRSISKQ